MHDDNSDLMLMSLFCGQLRQQVKYCASCLNQVQSEVDRKGDMNLDSLFFWLNTLLLHTANASLIVWPTAQESKQRGAKLRKAISMEKEVAFFKNRSFRNHIAHMDERLDKWHRESKNKNIARYSVGPRGMIGGLEKEEVFEHFVPDEAVYLFRGDEYELRTLSDVIKKLLPRISELASKSWWDDDFKSAFKEV